MFYFNFLGLEILGSGSWQSDRFQHVPPFRLSDDGPLHGRRQRRAVPAGGRFLPDIEILFVVPAPTQTRLLLGSARLVHFGRYADIGERQLSQHGPHHLDAGRPPGYAGQLPQNARYGHHRATQTR